MRLHVHRPVKMVLNTHFCHFSVFLLYVSPQETLIVLMAMLIANVPQEY